MIDIELIICFLSLFVIVYLQRKIVRKQEELDIAYIVLGYYKVKFGVVTTEEVKEYASKINGR